MEVGTRVKVCIPDDRAHTWARNYLAAVQGLTGVVIEKKVVDVGGPLRRSFGSTPTRLSPQALVLFDDSPEDPSPVAPRGRKLTQFWFPEHSLVKEK